MTISPEDLVRREVHYCVSYLVSTLAQNMGAVEFSEAHRDLADMTEQAFELACPIDDWEEAAIQIGWVERPATTSPEGVKSDWCVVRGTTAEDAEHAAGFKYAENWRDACESDDLEPYQREVFEHWIVSDWLADKLAERGEKVDKGFAGMIVWARTTSGQGIASDSVIEAICAELNAA